MNIEKHIAGISAYNKILASARPLKDVCAKDEAIWIAAKVRNEGSYENETHLFTKDK